MKHILFAVVVLHASHFCAVGQNNKLLLINSEKADTVTFEKGDAVVVQTNFSTRIRGRLNEINDTALVVDGNFVTVRSVSYIRRKNTPGMVLVKSIGATATALGLLSTFIIAAGHPWQPESSHQQLQYEEDLREYKKAMFISGSITAFSATSFLIHQHKYYFKKGWRPYLYLPSVVINADSAKTLANPSRLNDETPLYPFNSVISTNAVYFQFSTEATYSLFIDHLWKVNKALSISTSVGVSKKKYNNNFIIPVTIGCVIGRKQHCMEIGQMSWIAFDDSNPSLLGVVGYRFQSYKGQFFFRGGLQVTEVSENNADHRIHLFGSLGIGF